MIFISRIILELKMAEMLELQWRGQYYKNEYHLEVKKEKKSLEVQRFRSTVETVLLQGQGSWTLTK